MATVPTPQAAAAGPSALADRPDDWIPVERRWLGFDRATLPAALIVAGLVVLMQFVLPAIYRAVPYDDPVRAGDVMALSSGVTFEPAVGWNVVHGVREGGADTTGDVGRSAKVVSGDVGFEVTVDAFDGDAAGLLAQIRTTTDALNDDGDFHVVGDSAAFTTATGLSGRLSQYSSSRDTGMIAAIVQDGVGIEVVTTSGSRVDEATLAEVAAMLDSLTVTPEAGA